MSAHAASRKNPYLLPFIVLTSLFFMWGFTTVLVDALIPRLREVFTLTYFQAGLIQFAFFGAYLVLSLPAGQLITRIGYKKGILVGLATMAAGCLLFIPAAGLRVYVLFMLAMFVLAGGITILQVAANPYVAVLGPEETSSSRLTLAQAFNSLGTTIAPLVSAAYLLSDEIKTTAEIAALDATAREAYFAAEAGAVQGPFFVMALLLTGLAVAMAMFKLPRLLDANQPDAFKMRAVLQYPHLLFGAGAIFVYVGAEVAIGSYLVNFFLDMGLPQIVAQTPWMFNLIGTLSGEDPSTLSDGRLAGTLVAFYWGGAMVGRFLGSGVMRFFAPGKALGTYALVAGGLVSLAIVASGLPAVWTLLAVGLFNSIMFPTIFTLAIRGLGEHTAQGSGLLCMAIFGGAIIPPFYGFMADQVGLQLAFLVCVLCYLYISWYGFAGSRPRTLSPSVSV